jgi:hypothetical protein
MSPRRIGQRWLATIGLGTLAPLVLAQMTPPGGPGMHGHGHASPAAQECRKQADEKKLPAGDERHEFMHQCLEAKQNGSDAAKSAAARAKMGDPQSGHLRSDPPPAPASPPAG